MASASSKRNLEHHPMNITRRPTPRRIPTVFHLRRCRPAFWKFFIYPKGSKNKNHFSPFPIAGGGVRRGISCVGGGKVEVSARKLAAELWQLQFSARLSGGPASCDGDDLNVKCESYFGRLDSEIQSSLLYSKHTMEGASKGCSRKADKVYNGGMKLVKDHTTSTSRVASPIQAGLVHAQLRIHELEAEQQSFQKKFMQLLRKLVERRTSWLTTEHLKVHSVLDDLNTELKKQRKTYQTMEILNSKLVNKLADVRSSEKRFKQDYEKEKKRRELLEEICKELAHKIAEDEDLLEELKMESVKIQEEIEKERKMFQIAEIWREERVRMKLTDAKLALDDKYCQMNKLMEDLEAFLMSASANLDVKELSEAESFRQAAKSVKIEDIKEFSYMPIKPGDIYSILEEAKQSEDGKRMLELCVSKIQISCSVGQLEENAKDWDYHAEKMLEVSKTNVTNGWQSTRKCDEAVRNDSSTSGFYAAQQSLHRTSSKAMVLGSSNPSDQETRSCEGKPSLLRDLVNPHVIRGMKGWIEWPRQIPKNSLKARLLQAD